MHKYPSSTSPHSTSSCPSTHQHLSSAVDTSNLSTSPIQSYPHPSQSSSAFFLDLVPSLAENYTDQSHFDYPHKHNPKTRKVGIERIDGLLLNGKKGGVFEINVETPQTTADIYKNIGSFVKNTKVPVYLEELIKDSFIEGDWDDDAEIIPIFNDINDVEKNNNHQLELTQSLYSTELQNSSDYSRKLQDKPLRAYTLIKSIEYLYKYATKSEIIAYEDYKKALYNEYLSFERDNGLIFKENESIPLPAPKSGLLGYLPQFDNQNHNYPLSPIPSNSSKNTPIFKSKLKPPKLPKHILDALTYRPNNHTMFCLTIRDVSLQINQLTHSNQFNENIQIKMIQDYNNDVKDENNILDDNQKNYKIDRKIDSNTSSRYHLENLRNNFHHDTASQQLSTLPENIPRKENDMTGTNDENIYGIVICRLLSSHHVKNTIENGKKYNIDTLSAFIGGCNDKKVIDENDHQIISKNNPDQQKMIYDEEIITPGAKINQYNEEIPFNSNEHNKEEAPVGSIKQKNNHKTSKNCQSAPYFSNDDLDSIPTASINDLRYFLHHSSSQHPNNAQNGDDMVVGTTTHQISIEDVTDSSNAWNPVHNDHDQTDRPHVACYYPIIEEDSSDTDEYNDGTDLGDDINVFNDSKNSLQMINDDQIQDSDNVTQLSQESQEMTDLELLSPETQSFIAPIILTPSKYEKSSRNIKIVKNDPKTLRKSILHNQWVKIELIAIAEPHRSKGIGNLLLISSLLAGVLSQRFTPKIDATKFKNSRSLHENIVNNAMLCLAGGKKENPIADKLYENTGFNAIPPEFFKSPGNKDLYVLLEINKVFKKVKWGDLISGVHEME